ncbi:MAG: adenylate/guanylate cyclase domain-containing protein, partial [Rubrivivax sp.]|nr:adenylate/guanylate cyclase domain-containing protein [Rubrivivax sp.]
MNIDLAQLTMTEIIRLQTLLSQELSRRFEISAALAFTDIVGSTPYFERFGDEAGHQLQQLHFDLLADCLPAHGGRVVDTAGDGAFACFTSASAAADALTQLLQRVGDENVHRARDHQLTLRIGLHFGRVLSDGAQVTGDAVNLCARIAAAAEPGQIRLSREVFQEFDADHRLLCRRLPPTQLKGIAREVELFGLEWRDPMRFPSSVLIRETGQNIPLPSHDIVSFGRLDLIEGRHANDIVLALPDPAATRQISRWHFELRRRPDGYALRAMSGQSTVVDGEPVRQGQDRAVRPGSVVTLADTMTLIFLSPHGVDGASTEAT